MDTIESLEPYLRPGTYVDSDHPAVIAFAQREAAGATTLREVAVKLFYAVRDQVRYDPYHIDLSVGGLKASRCLATGIGFCITKAALLAAVLRVHGIATRLAFADVRNHMTSPRLQATMGTDIFSFHGNVDILLDGDDEAGEGGRRWVKATPAFNLSLCQKAGTKPLEFDGVNDSILHPFDLAGRRHMEYVRDRGIYADIPRETMLAAWDEIYPDTVPWKQSGLGQPVDADFEAEVRRSDGAA